MLKKYTLFALSATLCTLALTQANPVNSASTLSPFMTAQDVALDSSSQIGLENIGSGSVDVTGIFIQAMYYGPGGTNPLDNTVTTADQGYGMMWAPVTFPAYSAPPAPAQVEFIGANYLYNMVFQFMTVAALKDGSAPGTPGDGTTATGRAGNHTTYTWVIQLGVAKGAPVFVPSALGDNSILPTGDSDVITITCTDPTAITPGSCTPAGEVIQQFNRDPS